MEKYSCVLVLRNKEWFANSIGKLQAVWDIIEKERVTGYAHRAPNKRVKKESEKLEPIKANGCMLNFNKDDGKFVLMNQHPAPPQQQQIEIIKVRTESFDDTKQNMS